MKYLNLRLLVSELEEVLIRDVGPNRSLKYRKVRVPWHICIHFMDLTGLITKD